MPHHRAVTLQVILMIWSLSDLLCISCKLTLPKGWLRNVSLWLFSKLWAKPCSKSDHQDTIYLDWVILASHGDIFIALCSWFSFLCFYATQPYPASLNIFFKVLLRTLFCVFHYFLGRIHTGGSQSLYRGLRDTSFWDGNFSSLLQKELLCWTVAPLILDFLMLLSPSPLPFTFLMRVRAQSL